MYSKYLPTASHRDPHQLSVKGFSLLSKQGQLRPQWK